MIEELRKKVNNKIQTAQEDKQKLYDSISKLDNELLELNDILVKISNPNAFFEICPKDAFDMLSKLGYEGKQKQLDIYLELISENEDETKYINKIENFDKREEQTENQKETSKKLINFFEKIFPSDDKYYYIANVKVSKFRINYNMINLYNGNFKNEEIIPMLKVAFCYKNVNEDEKSKVCLELDKISSRIIEEIENNE